MDISIVLVNYNTKHLLSDCIASVYKQTAEIQYEVIIVDNKSTDDSEKFIKALYPQVRWINAEENLGFGRANNLGAQQAKGKYLFFLNSDTILKNNASKFFYDYFEHHQHDIGALGGWLEGPDGKICNSYGEFPSPLNELRYLFKKITKQKQVDNSQIKEVDFISGADLFLPKKVFEQLGKFDYRIFMYYEETDLQFRMNKQHLRRLIIPGPRIVHLEGGSFTSSGLSYNRFRMSQISYNYYLKKHFKGIRYACFRVSLIIIRLTVFFNVNWSWKNRFRAYYLVLTGDDQ